MANAGPRGIGIRAEHRPNRARHLQNIENQLREVRFERTGIRGAEPFTEEQRRHYMLILQERAGLLQAARDAKRLMVVDVVDGMDWAPYVVVAPMFGAMIAAAADPGEMPDAVPELSLRGM